MFSVETQIYDTLDYNRKVCFINLLMFLNTKIIFVGDIDIYVRI